jgi:hypothetical protein
LANAGKDDSPKEIPQLPPRILIETSIMIAFSGILFAFLLNIATRTPENFTFFDRFVLLVALYSSCISICSFITPVIYHKLRLDRYVKRLENAVRVGAIAALIAVFLSLGIALGGLFNKDIAYGFAALPFIIIGLAVSRK